MMIYGIKRIIERLGMESKKISQFPRGKSSFFYGYFVVGASLMIMLITWGVYNAFGVFFKPVLNEFGWTRAMTSGALSVAFIINALLTILMGGFTDKFGPRIVLTFCGLLLGLGFILMSQMNSLLHLYLFYGIFVGAGMSGSFVPLISTVARWFLKRRGLMTGIVAAGSGMGILTGPPVASRLIPIYGWRVSYAILGGIVLFVVVLFAQFIKRDPTQVGQVAYGENQIEQNGSNLRMEGLSLREAVYCPRFWVFLPMCFCYGYCVFGMVVHIVPHAIELKISAIRAANILATIGGLSILGKVFLGRVGDIIGSRNVLMLGFILMSAALIWLVPANKAWMLFSSAAIFGFAFGGISVSHSPLIAELFGLRSHGLIFGVFNLGVMGGAATGPLLNGYIFDVTDSYQMAFLLSTVISSAGILLAVFLKTMKR
jgi:MFS family permease